MAESTRILVVEDNASLAFGLRTNLEVEGYEVAVVADGRAALDAVESSPPQLMILDLMLPDVDGWAVLEALRRRDDAVPVLVLTARGEETDKVAALRRGADDYVTKPFGLMELLARVEALLRRTRAAPTPPSSVYAFGDVRVDVATRSVTRAGASVALAPREFDLLVALAERAGRAASRLELLRDVWGHGGAVITRTVDTHIGELRRKLEVRPAEPRYILTVRKVGYRLASVDAGPEQSVSGAQSSP